jgi:hypothetical protein
MVLDFEARDHVRRPPCNKSGWARVSLLRPGDCAQRPLLPLVFRKTSKCGKLVKLFAHGTKVFSLIPHHFHHNTLTVFWPISSLHLVF